MNRCGSEALGDGGADGGAGVACGLYMKSSKVLVVGIGSGAVILLASAGAVRVCCCFNQAIDEARSAKVFPVPVGLSNKAFSRLVIACNAFDITANCAYIILVQSVSL